MVVLTAFTLGFNPRGTQHPPAESPILKLNSISILCRGTLIVFFSFSLYMSESKLSLAEKTGLSIVSFFDKFAPFFGGLLGVSVLIDSFLNARMFVFDTLVLPSFILFLLYGLSRILFITFHSAYFSNVNVEIQQLRVVKTLVSVFGTYIVIGLLSIVVPSNTVSLLLLASTGVLMMFFTTTDF